MKTKFDIDDVVEVQAKIVAIYIYSNKSVRYKMRLSDGTMLDIDERYMEAVDEQQT